MASERRSKRSMTYFLASRVFQRCRSFRSCRYLTPEWGPACRAFSFHLITPFQLTAPSHQRPAMTASGWPHKAPVLMGPTQATPSQILFQPDTYSVYFVKMGRWSDWAIYRCSAVPMKHGVRYHVSSSQPQYFVRHDVHRIVTTMESKGTALAAYD